MECQCDKDAQDAASGLWLNSSSVQMGAFTVVGYLLYRFSQTLPALIRWPIRLFCSLTGLSALWGWVSRLVGTIRGIQSLFQFLSQIWRFFVGLSSKFKWPAAAIKDGALESTINSPNGPGLRLILLGPAGGGQTSLAEMLLGDIRGHTGPLMKSTKRMRMVNGNEVTVINTPDLLGSSLSNSQRAMEALRTLQLASPGPQAFLLVIRAPGSSTGIDQDVAQEVQATIKLFGDGAAGFILPVLTYTDRLPHGRRSIDQLLARDTGSLRAALALCNQMPELVDNRPERPKELQTLTRRQLLGRVMEMNRVGGHFVHELQRKEDHIREELLADMSSTLARKLTYK